MVREVGFAVLAAVDLIAIKIRVVRKTHLDGFLRCIEMIMMTVMAIWGTCMPTSLGESVRLLVSVGRDGQPCVG